MNPMGLTPRKRSAARPKKPFLLRTHGIFLGTGEVSKSLTTRHRSMHSTPVVDKAKALMLSSMVAVTYRKRKINDSSGGRSVNECRSLSRTIVPSWTWACEGSNTPSQLHHHRVEIGCLVKLLWIDFWYKQQKNDHGSERRSGWML